MTIEKVDVVDYAGVETATGKMILSMVDHLGWEDVLEHLLILQEKINRYVAFIESGEIIESCPSSQGRDVVIAILTLFPLSDDDRVSEFMRQVRSMLDGVGVELRVTMLREGELS